MLVENRLPSRSSILRSGRRFRSCQYLPLPGPERNHRLRSQPRAIPCWMFYLGSRSCLLFSRRDRLWYGLPLVPNPYGTGHHLCRQDRFDKRRNCGVIEICLRIRTSTTSTWMSIVLALNTCVGMSVRYYLGSSQQASSIGVSNGQGRLVR